MEREAAEQERSGNRDVKWVFKTYVFRFLNLKISKSQNFRFLVFFTCETNLMQMIFKYELRFVAFTWPNLLVGRYFVSVVCKLKTLKKLKSFKKTKNLKLFL